MAINTRLEQANALTLLSTELNSLANGTGVVSSVGGTSGLFDSSHADLDHYLFGKFELSLAAPATAFTAGAVNVWFLHRVDGTNLEDGSASLAPKRPADLTFYVQASASAQRIIVSAPLPVGAWKVLVLPLGLGAGAVLAASGNTLKVKANTTQSA
jgi:hypothetical protein